jgi:asparagine synthase (glutamine-hydrolysing)
MCGICGELSLGASGPVSAEHVRAMRDLLVHRGPDSHGVFISLDGAAGLGFRRLRIIDLSESANQPMPNEDASVHLVFNGEIYNFAGLRERLVAGGHRFRSHSDSEVIVHLYEDQGDRFVDELEGMFAIALWDARRRRLLLARDRAGKKPLFVYRDASRVAFASEIKAFFGHPEISLEANDEALPYYFIHGYVPRPETFYRRVSQIEPGTIVAISPDGRVDRRRYWKLRYPRAAEQQTLVTDRRDATGRVRSLVTQAVERRLISDVPVGAFLSGGIDSTIVVGLMAALTRAPVKTFSIGFDGDPEYDETRYARDVAERFATDHTEFLVTPSAIDLIDTLLWHHDGPFGDSSAIPTYLVSQLTRQHVTVVLTGDGGDELFAGYRRFHAALVADRLPASAGPLVSALLAPLPAAPNERHWLSRARRFAQSMALPPLERLTRWSGYFFEDLDELLASDFRQTQPPIDRLRYLRAELDELQRLSPLGSLLLANFDTYLPEDLLVKTDRMTMAASIEARAPLLDRELTEYAATLPDAWKLSRAGRTKLILRDAFADLIPPHINKRGKMGFGVPLDRWFRGALRPYVRDTLLGPGARCRVYLSTATLETLVRRHESGEANLGQQIWCLLAFERWLELLPAWQQRQRPVAPLIASASPVG